MALSLRGIARRYGGITGGFSIANNIFGGEITGSVSLKTKLESMAREEHAFDVSECIFDWRAAFEQTWTHIRVRIRLNPDAGIPAATINTLQNTWATGIQTTWSNRWGCGRPDEATCPLTFEVQWVNSNEHHTVRVSQCPSGGSCHTNSGHWHTTDSGAIAAHEFGHLLGHPDEYTDSNCPNRNPVNTGTVMDNNSNNVPARLLQRFADNLGSNVIAI